jgi:sulfite exporter TauE/SafE
LGLHLTVLGALFTGLLGSVGHCVGMCGPLVATVSLATAPRAGAAGTLAVHALYNAGRITTYGFVGLLMGLTGSFVDVAGRAAGLQSVVSVLAGATMMLMGLGAAGVAPPFRRLEQRLAGRVFGVAQGLLDGAGTGRAYALGLLLGLLPCGLSYSIFVGAAATGSPLEGSLLALAFGLGTAPALMLLGGATAWLSARVRGVLYRLGGAAVVLLGLRFVLRGLGVDAL